MVPGALLASPTARAPSPYLIDAAAARSVPTDPAGPISLGDLDGDARCQQRQVADTATVDEHHHVVGARREPVAERGSHDDTPTSADRVASSPGASTMWSSAKPIPPVKWPTTRSVPGSTSSASGVPDRQRQPVRRFPSPEADGDRAVGPCAAWSMAPALSAAQRSAPARRWCPHRAPAVHVLGGTGSGIG